MKRLQNISFNKLYSVLIVLIFCLGIFLRLKTYLYNISFWYDEAALALNVIDRGIFGFFRYLDYVQCAPPAFMMLSKIITNLFGAKEWAFRLLPFIFGIASMFVFYLLSKEILNKKYSVLVANCLFAINFQLIYYCQEFKQYSAEVFVTLLVVFFFKRLNVQALNARKCFCIGFVFFIMFLFSMTIPFVLAAFIIYLMYKSRAVSIKRIFFILFPFTLLFLPYYLFFLWPSKALMLRDFTDMWSPGFLSLNFETIKTFFANFFRFTFEPNNVPILGLILTITGMVLVFKDKKRLGAIILLVVFAAFIASMLHIYPIHIRLGLYLVPFFILFAVKPLDICSFKTFDIKIYSWVAILIFILCFRGYGVKYFSNFFSPVIFHKSLSREMMHIIKNDLGENDVIVYDNKSLPAYFYYLEYFNINHKNSMRISSLSYKDFSKLFKGNVWFYCTHEADKNKDAAIVKWIVHNAYGAQILYEKEILGSYIVKVKFN